jgi:hypothetical protein
MLGACPFVEPSLRIVEPVDVQNTDATGYPFHPDFGVAVKLVCDAFEPI